MDTDPRLIRISIDQIHPHPASANVMAPDRKQKLQRHIARTGTYPPVVVRAHPDIPGAYQVIDGHQRTDVLAELGREDVRCFLWPCDDTEALLLLATLNRLEGEDVPAKRAALIAELAALLPEEELAQLLPEDASAIEEALQLFDLDVDALLEELTTAAEERATAAPRAISFVVTPSDEAAIEATVTQVAATLEGRNRRGRALAQICRAYTEAGHA